MNRGIIAGAALLVPMFFLVVIPPMTMPPEPTFIPPPMTMPPEPTFIPTPMPSPEPTFMSPSSSSLNLTSANDVVRWHQISNEYSNNPWLRARCKGCEYTNMSSDADYIFVLPRHKPSPLGKATYIAQWWESASDPYVKSESTARSLYPYSLSYRADSTFPCFSMVQDTFGRYGPVPELSGNPNVSRVLPDGPVPWERKKRQNRAMMSVWISNMFHSSSGRIEFLRKLLQHNVTATSYSKMRLNFWSPNLLPPVSDFDPPKWPNMTSGEQKMVWSAQHLFLFAAENTISPYYITEKLYHGLIAGSVPVFHGDTTGIEGYVPENSIITTKEFDFDPARLAAYLIHVANNQTLYESYLAWRKRPLPPALQQKLDQRCENNICAMCDFLRQKKAERSRSS